MKLVRFGSPGEEQPGMIDGEGRLRDLSGVVGDIDGSTVGPRGLGLLEAVDASALPAVGGDPRLGPCVGAVPKLVCIGLNYRDHAEETGLPIPAEPVLFMKATSAISGPRDDIMLPEGSEKTDWEAELGVVIGTRARYVEVNRAMAHVAGYCVGNDVSERAHQLEGTGQWVKGKSADTFAPLGPWLVTRDEVADPQALDVWLEVNGERRQDGNTRTMIFTVAELVSYVSRHMTLEPGDVMLTGTPPGVGLGCKPPRFLEPGDVVRLGVAGLGEQRQTVVPFARQG